MYRQLLLHRKLRLLLQLRADRRLQRQQLLHQRLRDQKGRYRSRNLLERLLRHLHLTLL